MSDEPKWGDVSAVVLCLVADKLCRTVNEEDEHADDPPALRAARYALQRRDTARSSMAPAEEEEEVSPGSPGPSSQPLASLRLVCKSWKDAIDKCLEYLTLFRWPPSRTALPALFPSVRCVDLAWLERHPLGQAALAALMAQLAGLTKLGRLVLGQALLLAPAGPGPTRRNELRALKAGPRCLLLPPSLPQLTGLTSLAVLARPSDPATEDIAHMQHSLINPAVEQPPALALPSLQGLELALSSVVLRAVLQGLAPDTLRGLSKLQLLAMDKQGGGIPQSPACEPLSTLLLTTLSSHATRLRHLELANVLLTEHSGNMVGVLAQQGHGPGRALLRCLQALQALEVLQLRNMRLPLDQVKAMRTELRLPALTELLVQRCEGCWVEVLLEAAAAAFPAVRKLWVQQLSTGRLSAQQKQEHAEHMRQQGQQARQAQQAGRQQVAEAAAAVAGPPAFEALEELRLQQCSELKVLPRQLAAMKALRRLELSSCGLRSMAALPASCSGLTALVVEGMVELHSTADELFTQLASLQQLTFQAMFIRKVPSSLADLAGLQRLVLGTGGPLEAQVAAQLAARVQLQELEACCSDMRAAVQLLACLERHKPAVALYNSMSTLCIAGQLQQLGTPVSSSGAGVRVSTMGRGARSGCMVSLAGSMPDAGVVVGEDLPALPAWLVRRLKVLHLYHMKLQQLPWPAADMPDLTTLALPNNCLAQLPPDLPALLHLQHLDMAHNVITQLPEWLWHLPQLVYADLSDNRIASLEEEQQQEQQGQPEQQGQQQGQEQQEAADLGQQGRRKRQKQEPQQEPQQGQQQGQQGAPAAGTAQPSPSSPAAPSKLAQLQLAENDLCLLPASVLQHWAGVQTLDLSSNALQQLPQQLWQLPSLQRLLLGSNGLEELPALPQACAATSSLQRLELSRNQLFSLPASLAQLTALKSISLDAPLAADAAVSELKSRTEAAGARVEVVTLAPAGMRAAAAKDGARRGKAFRSARSLLPVARSNVPSKERVGGYVYGGPDYDYDTYSEGDTDVYSDEYDYLAEEQEMYLEGGLPPVYIDDYPDVYEPWM